MKQISIFVLSLFFSAYALSAQTFLKIKVTDLDTNEEIIGGSVKVLKGKNIVRGAITDFAGDARIPLDPGKYAVEVSYTGYKILTIEDVIVHANELNQLEISLTTQETPNTVEVIDYRVPSMPQDQTGCTTFSPEFLKQLPSRNPQDIVFHTATATPEPISGIPLTPELLTQNFLTIKVTDEETGEELIGAPVKVLQGKKIVREAITDVTGDARIPIDPGTYTVAVSYTGFKTHQMEGVIVLAGELKHLDISLTVQHTLTEEITCKVPLIKKNPIGGIPLTPELLTQTFLTIKVTAEETGEELVGASVIVLKGATLLRGTMTDASGDARFPLDPGTYTVEVSSTGFSTRKIEGVNVLSGKYNHLDISLNQCTFGFVEKVEYKEPLIRQDETSTGQTLKAEKIHPLPRKKPREPREPKRRKSKNSN